MKSKLFLSTVIAGLVVSFTQLTARADDHPEYLHALGDLRAARWLIDHRPGNGQPSVQEQDAIKQIDLAVDAIKKSSIDDGKDINDHPQADEKPDQSGRLQVALEYLEKAQKDVKSADGNGEAGMVKSHTLQHIFAAIERTKFAMKPGTTPDATPSPAPHTN